MSYTNILLIDLSTNKQILHFYFKPYMVEDLEGTMHNEGYLNNICFVFTKVELY